MADDTQLGAPVGSGDVISTDDLGTKKVQRVKVQHGTDGSATDVSTSSPMPADLTNASVADGGALPSKGVQVGGTDGTVFQVLSTDSAGRLNANINGTVPVSDAAGSLTVDASAASFAVNDAQIAGTAYDVNSGNKSAGTQRVVLATDQPQLTNALKVDGSAVTQPVSGTVTANAGTGPFPVSDNAGSLTVDAPVATPVFVRLSDGAAAITALPVTDNAGSLTVDNAGTFAVQPTANSQVDVNRIAGTATSVNSGTKDAGTQRVVLATDQPALSNALLTQPVPVNTVSTANSSTATLAGGAAFTGTSEDISGYAIIFVNVIASHASATDGLSCQQSSDGTNWDIVDTYTIPATTGKAFSLNPVAKFFRIVYTNGATLQTSFRLQTIYKRFYGKPSSQRPSDGYSNEVDLEQAMTFPSVWNGATWDRLPGAAASGLTTNMKTLNGTAVDVNSGAKSAGTQRVILASDQTVVPVSDNSGSLTVDAPLATPVFVTATPSTTGGWSKVKYAAQTTTKQAVKASAGTFGGYYAYNPNASVAYIQVFDVASASVTVGTTAPDMIFGIPAGSAANLEVTNGVNMATAITLVCTTTATGSTAPGTGLDLTIFYK